MRQENGHKNFSENFDLKKRAYAKQLDRILHNGVQKLRCIVLSSASQVHQLFSNMSHQKNLKNHCIELLFFLCFSEMASSESSYKCTIILRISTPGDIARRYEVIFLAIKFILDGISVWLCP